MSLQTLYQFYTEGGITTGLNTTTTPLNQAQFTLNHHNITLYSGAVHYFRVPKPYWRDRLRKLRAAGLNTVETYIPWNLHEPQNGTYDFGDTNSDMSEFLNVKEFLNVAQQEDLLAIVRPGPYICAEWEFGGLPSWLLREPNAKLRTSSGGYMKYVHRYFSVLLPILAALQFTRGGPIIGVQLENEYGSTWVRRGNRNFTEFVPDRTYLTQLKTLMDDNGIVELLFTSDGVYNGDKGSLPGVFKTINFGKKPNWNLDQLKKLQPNGALMVMEFWSGWFDFWDDGLHKKTALAEFQTNISVIIEEYRASVNFYMFHGGTNWGFLNGANSKGINNADYHPITTSYDYDAPLTESGDYTEKYHFIREVLLRKQVNAGLVLPELPVETPKRAHKSIEIKQFLAYEEIIKQIPVVVQSKNVLPMELLPINNSSGQSYGYTVYRVSNLTIPQNSQLTVKGYVYDAIMVLLDGVLISPQLVNESSLDGFGFWRLENGTLQINNNEEKFNVTLDLVVLNMGRNNYGFLEQFAQYKGLRDDVLLNGVALENWSIFPLEFRTKWTNSLKNWSNHKPSMVALYKAELWKTTEEFDSFIDMSEWTTGAVMVNGFVLGRYMKTGSQKCLYLPGVVLREGRNDIVIFEHFEAAPKITFSDRPIFSRQK